MTTLREAAQQALKALEFIDKEFKKHGRQHWPEAVKAHSAIAPLRAALAEPPTNQCGETCERAKLCAACARELAEPVQEPVAWMHTNGVGHVYFRKKPQDRVFNPQPLYTAPPQRKPLSEEEIKECERQAMVNGALPFEQRVLFARAIERAHGIGVEE